MTEPVLLTLFFAIAAAALIGAVNARGTIRTVISYALAAVCLGLAVYHTYRYEARQTAAMDILTTPSAPPDMAPAPDSQGGATADTSMGQNAAQNQGLGQGQNQGQDQGQNSNQNSNENSNQGGVQSPIDQSSANSDLHKILRDARQLQNELSAVNLATVSQISDAEYARMQTNARQYSTDAQNLQTRMATLTASPPMGQEEALQGLTAAIGYLASASQELERFFSSENTADEKMHAAGFRSGTHAAGLSLEKVESRTGGAETSAP